jgi:predicted dienelactone hydrolase
MTRTRWISAGLSLSLLSFTAGPVLGAGPAHWPSIDAPELAGFGEFSVGVRTLELLQHEQADMLQVDPKSGVAPRRDRHLTVDLWYPAQSAIGAAPATYTTRISGETPGSWTKYEIRGVAVRDARPIKGRYPLVVVSHGLSSAPALMTWLTENLASKGYVVAAIRHEDLAYTDPMSWRLALLRRPLDIAFVAQTLQSRLDAEELIDPKRTALVGYSLGSYGVLTVAGATLDPNSPAQKFVPGGLLLPYARGGRARESIRVKNVVAVVALAPFGLAPVAAWDRAGVAEITAPLLLIAGDRDHTVDYTTNARALLDEATGAHRYLLTYRGAGHNLGLGPTTDAMRQRMWDFDWVEDPVWRQDRIFGINLHMITAFLDRYVKGDESRASYLDVPVQESDAGVWPAPGPATWDAYSSGANGVTVWKGFQRNHAVGLELQQREARVPAN